MTEFRSVRDYVTLPYNLGFAIAVPLSQGERTTFVDVYDRQKDVSNFFIQRHGAYVNPYRRHRRKETVLEKVPRREGGEEEREAEEQTARVSFEDRRSGGWVSEEAKRTFLDDLYTIAETSSEGKGDDDDDDNDDNADKEESREGEGSARLQVTALNRTVEDEVNPLLVMEQEYRSSTHVFIPVKEATEILRGVYWANEAHWEDCNTDLFTVPSPLDMANVMSSMTMPYHLNDIHGCFVLYLHPTMQKDVGVPNDLGDLKVSFPHIPINLDRTTENCLYEKVTTSVLVALQGVPSRPLPRTVSCAKTDYGDSCCLVECSNLYADNTLNNPLSISYNAYMRNRWHLLDYELERRRITGCMDLSRKEAMNMKQGRSSSNSSSSSSWCRFTVRNDTIFSVTHSNGTTYGEPCLSDTPLENMAKAVNAFKAKNLRQSVRSTGNGGWHVINSMNKVLEEGLSLDSCIVVYMNTKTGHLFITHPLFPAGKCVRLGGKEYLERDELRLWTTHIRENSKRISRMEIQIM